MCVIDQLVARYEDEIRELQAKNIQLQEQLDSWIKVSMAGEALRHSQTFARILKTDYIEAEL
jgi:hypothetical protein